MNTGTDIKINVHIEPIDRLTMDDYNFECTFFTDSSIKKQTCKKDKMIRIDAQNYIAMVCTDRTGYGDLKMRITAWIPDEDIYFHDGFRKEELLVKTGITINK